MVYQTETYEPYPLQRSTFRQTQELTKAGLEINSARDLPFVADSMASPLIGVVVLTIYRRHRSDAEVQQWWKGRVKGLRFSGSEAIISCDPLGTAVRRIGLHRPAQRQCPHALYEIGCNLAGASFSATGSLLSYVGSAVTSSVFATQPNGWWVGGKIVLDGVLRFIVDHTTDTVTLSSGIPGLAQNAGFVVYPGCDHTPVTCSTKFSNVLNYGGAPWWPSKNPFTGDSAF
jgi:hypothetical protein